MRIVHCEGNILDQKVDVIVNAWNRNIIPWWLLIPKGVSGAIKKQGGIAPFKELAQKGIMTSGSAVETSAGKLPFKAIIHVAGINIFWRSTEQTIRDSTKNAMNIVKDKAYASVAFPLIGAGSGGTAEERVFLFIRDELSKIEYGGEVIIVGF